MGIAEIKAAHQQRLEAEQKELENEVLQWLYAAFPNVKEEAISVIIDPSIRESAKVVFRKHAPIIIQRNFIPTLNNKGFNTGGTTTYSFYVDHEQGSSVFEGFADALLFAEKRYKPTFKERWNRFWGKKGKS